MRRVTCTKCNREGLLRNDRLVKEYGEAMLPPELAKHLASNFHRLSFLSYDPCRVILPQLVEIADSRNARSLMVQL